MMEFTAEMIAGFLGGDIVGDKETKVHTVSSIEEGKAGSLTYLTNPKYETFLYSTGASIVLVNRSFEPSQQVSATLIKVDDAAACVLKLLEMYNAAKPRRSGISKLASVAEKAEVGADCYIGDFTVVEAGVKIGKNCQIYPQVYLGAGVTVGEGTILYPGVKVYEGCRIGRNCILHAGAVVGADGFGFMPNAAGGFDKIPQLGNVVIEDDVEIGANTCIDRAKTDSTVIRRGVKLDGWDEYFDYDAWMAAFAACGIERIAQRQNDIGVLGPDTGRRNERRSRAAVLVACGAEYVVHDQRGRNAVLTELLAQGQVEIAIGLFPALRQYRRADGIGIEL